MSLKPGDAAPAFTLADDTGATRTLADWAGRTVVFYFYPKDNTPGCTTEAQAFRDLHAEFDSRGVAVVGVSPDSPRTHAGFKAKHQLPFTLLSDPEHGFLAACGAWGEKTMYGKKVTGVIRSTLVVGPDGQVVRVYPTVKVNGHAEAVLQACSVG